MEIIAEAPGYLRLVYHPDRNFIVFDWTSFNITLESIQKMHEKALAAAKAKNCYYFVAETSKVKTVLSKDIIQWWGDVWVPKLVQSGLKAIVTVVPASAIATASTYTWQREVVGEIIMENVSSFLEATVVVKSIQENKA